MHGTYLGSTVSIRSRGSLGLSWDDHSYLLNERSDRTPLTQSSCCACCGANFIHGVPINPGFLYGLRQSTLIQWAPSRRLLLGGGDGFYRRIPFYSLDRGCYEVCCTVKKRIGDGGIVRRGRGKIECAVSKGNSGRRHLGGEADAEAMLSLLTEEVSERFDDGWETCGSTYESFLADKRGTLGNESYRRKKKNGRFGSSECSSKRESRSDAVRSREEACRRREEKEAAERVETRGQRKEGSSCSSYYSLSSAGEVESNADDFEDNQEVQGKHWEIQRGSSSGYKKDSWKAEAGKFDSEVTEKFEKTGKFEKKRRDETGRYGEVSKGSTSMGSGVEWERTKKSEKKLAEVSIEQNESMEESTEINSKVSQIREVDYEKTSGSHKQFHGRGEKFTVASNFDVEARKQYGQKGKLVIGQSDSGRTDQRLLELSEVQGSNVESTSGSQSQFSGSEENVTTSVKLLQGRKEEHREKDGHIIAQDKSMAQQLSETSMAQEVGIRNTSTSVRQSGTIMKNWKENSTSFQSSVQETKEQQHQTGEGISRRKSLQVTETSDIHDSHIQKNSLSQTQRETRIINQEGNLNMVSSPHQEAKKQLSGTDKTRRNESRKVSQDATSISVVHSSDTETDTNSRRTSEKRVNNQEINLTSVVKSVQETRERYYQTDESLVQTRSRKEVEKPSKLPHFIETAPGDSSSSQASLNLVAQARIHQIAVEERDKTISQATMKPPPSQLVERGTLHPELSSGFATPVVPGRTPESGFSASSTPLAKRSPTLQRKSHGETRKGETYGEPLNIGPVDVLDSADRLEKSSMHFVGEFVEKVRHDVLTSEIQKERVSEANMLYEGEIPEKHKQSSSSQYSSENLQLKEHDSRRSSGGARNKGPSDEMWNVQDPSPQELPKTEATEGTTNTGTAIVRRTGKSFWSIVADIVRMRWVTHSETHNSAMKSGGRSSTNESAGSEAWFSGNEPDERNNKNAKKEKRTTGQESLSHDQPQLGKSPTLDQGEGSQATSTRDQKKHAELDMASSSVLESGSMLKSSSSASGKESLGSYEIAESFQGSPLSSSVVESMIPTPIQRIGRSPAVEEVSSTTETVRSGSSSMEMIGQKVDVPLSEMSGTEEKAGELKRRKLQRNKQVLRDRFDEWEEAYALESEQRKIDEMFMREAMLEAKKAGDAWEVPVGAVLVQHGQIIARGCNLVEELRDSTAHAEMICIREGSNLLRTWRLSDTTLYVTLEPCPMCAGAILQARIDTLVWGAPNKLLGADGSWIRLFPDGGEGGRGSEQTDKPQAPVHPFHPKMTIRRGVLASECSDTMRQFFQLRRKKKEKKPEPDQPAPPSCLPITNHPKFMTKMHGIFHMFCL